MASQVLFFRIRRAGRRRNGGLAGRRGSAMLGATMDTIHALLVTSTPSDTDGFGRLLAGQGFLLTVLPSDETAFAHAHAHKPAVMVVALGHNVPDTLALTERLRNICPLAALLVVGPPEGERPKLPTGVDAYLPRPVTDMDFLSLLDTVRRRPVSSGRAYVCGRLVIDIEAKEARVGDTPLTLSPLDYALLETLTKHKNYVLSKDRLMDFLFGAQHDTDPKLIDLCIYRLRRILAEHQAGAELRTEWTVGYTLSDPPPLTPVHPTEF